MKRSSCSVPMSVGRVSDTPLGYVSLKYGSLDPPACLLLLALVSSLRTLTSANKGVFLWLMFSIAVDFEIRLQKREVFRGCAERRSLETYSHKSCFGVLLIQINSLFVVKFIHLTKPVFVIRALISIILLIRALADLQFH